MGRTTTPGSGRTWATLVGLERHCMQDRGEWVAAMLQPSGGVELEAAPVLLGVDHEHPTRADHQVVGGPAAWEGQVVQDRPAVPLQLAEQPGGASLPGRPTLPGDGVGAGPEPQSHPATRAASPPTARLESGRRGCQGLLAAPPLPRVRRPARAGFGSRWPTRPPCAALRLGLLAHDHPVPALLVIFGRWVFTAATPPSSGSAEPTERGLWARIGRRMAPGPGWSGSSPRWCWARWPGVTQLEAGSLQSKDSFRTKPEAVAGRQRFGPPLPAGGGLRPGHRQRRGRAATPGRRVRDPGRGVTAVTPPVVKDGYAYLEGTLTSAADSQAGYATVDQLRSSVHAIPGIPEAKVGGGSAVNLDIQQATRRPQPGRALVLLVVLVILALVLRAIVAPLLLLVATVVLSFAAALGVGALVFDLFGFAGSDGVPAVDLCVPGRVGHRLQHLPDDPGPRGGQDRHRRGALIGLAATGEVITSAGIVLAGTFAALGTLPLVFITEIGFAVAFGVLLDTFVVRSVLVTALSLDVGRWIWWPSRLHHKRDDLDLDQLESEAAEVSR